MPKPFNIAPERKQAVERLGEAQSQYEAISGNSHALAVGYEDKNSTFITNPFMDSTNRFSLNVPEDVKAFNKSGFAKHPVELLERLAKHIEDALNLSEDMSSEQISRVQAHIENAAKIQRLLES